MSESISVKLSQRNTQFAIIAFLVMALVLLLMPFERAHDRLIGEFFNVGHIVLFASLAALLLSVLSALRAMSFFRQLFCIAAAFAVIGIATEGLQAFTQRTPSWRDVGLDMAGGILAVAFLSRQMSPYIRQIRLAALVLALVMMWPGVQVLRDEWNMQQQFPILAEMASDSELTRWETGGNTLEREYVSAEQRYRLRTNLRVAAFSSVALVHFKRDWRGFDKIVFEFDNPQSLPLATTIRIHDATHERGDQSYADRFNYHFRLQPGKNRIELPLQRIEAGPKQRKLDLGDVANIGIFVTGLKAPVILNIDQIVLVKRARD